MCPFPFTLLEAVLEFVLHPEERLSNLGFRETGVFLDLGDVLTVQVMHDENVPFGGALLPEEAVQEIGRFEDRLFFGVGARVGYRLRDHVVQFHQGRAPL